MPRGCRKETTINLIGGIFCHICDKIFKTKEDYELHYIIHEKANTAIQYTCVVCHQVLTGYSKFRNHCYNMHTNAHKFKCEHCEKSFHKQAVLDLHIKKVHTFKCKHPNCMKQFPTEQKLHMHEFIHRSKANKPPYQCKTCNETVTTINQCEQHIDDHSNICYFCPICNEELTKETAMKHLVTHFGSDDVEFKPEEIKSVDADYSSVTIAGGILCHLCNEVFKNRHELDSHFQEDHPSSDITYTCIICNKQYSKYSLFGSHSYEHLWKNKFECEHCPRLFPRLALLVHHVAAEHAAGARVHCHHCDREFATVRHFRHHMREQHEIDLLTCTHDGCEKTFESPKELVLHEKTHKGSWDGWCRACGLDLDSARAAARHLPRHAQRRFNCPVCHATYIDKNRLITDHMPTHFESVFHMCKMCAKVFAEKRRLMAHLRTHSAAKRYACSQCGRSFAKTNHLQQHIAMHSGQMPYKCTDCDKSFSNYPNYNKHMRKVHKVDTKTLKKSDVDKQIAKSSPTKENKVNSLSETNPSAKADPYAMDPDSIDSIEIDKDSQIFKTFTADGDTIIEFDSDIEGMLVEPTAPSAAAVPPHELGPDFVTAPPEGAALPPHCIALGDPPLPHVNPLLIGTPEPVPHFTPKRDPPALYSDPLPLQYPFDAYETGLTEPMDSFKCDSPLFPKIYRSLYNELDDVAAGRLTVINTDMY